MVAEINIFERYGENSQKQSKIRFGRRLMYAHDPGGSERRRRENGTASAAWDGLQNRLGMLLLAQRGNGNRGGTSSGSPPSIILNF